MKTKHISWIDGLKGLSCILIFIHHFSLSFYPSIYYGSSTPVHSSLALFLSDNPLGFFLNGQFFVCIFCILSGIVISYQLFNHSNDTAYLSQTFFKRYFRLAIPICIVSFFVYIFLKLGLIHNLPVAEITGSPWLSAFYTDSLHFKDIFTYSFLDVLFQSDATFCTAFWMITYIFYGTFLSAILCVISNNRSKRIFVLFFLVFIVFLRQNSLLCCFVLGTMIAYTMFYITVPHNYPTYIAGIFFIIAGIFLGVYPTILPPSSFYAFLNHLPDILTPYKFYHTIGAFLLISGIHLFSPLGDLLGQKFFTRLGSISFSLYLIHIPFLFSFSMILYEKVFAVTTMYNLSVMITFACSLPLLLLLSALFYHFIEKKCALLTQQILKFF